MRPDSKSFDYKHRACSAAELHNPVAAFTPLALRGGEGGGCGQAVYVPMWREASKGGSSWVSTA
eukprot:1161670-Pelagomonas_calceolata.AAC.5